MASTARRLAGLSRDGAAGDRRAPRTHRHIPHDLALARLGGRAARGTHAVGRVGHRVGAAVVLGYDRRVEDCERPRRVAAAAWAVVGGVILAYGVAFVASAYARLGLP